MLRVHFTTEDMIGITVATEPEPLCEALFSLQVLCRSEDQLLYGEWRRRTHARLSSLRVSTMELRSLFTSPLGASLRHRPASEWINARAEVDQPSGGVDALRVYWGAGVQPYWLVMQRLVHADVEHRGRAALAGGVTGLLSGLHSNVFWRPPVMVVKERAERDLFLNGRGMSLLPSFFCWPGPVLIDEHETRPVLLYPVHREPGWVDSARNETTPRRSIAALMGRTRAAVLEASDQGRTTTQIAERVGVSLPTASQHTSVLRSAGLITTRRRGAAVIHETTPLGTALLRGQSTLTDDRLVLK
jgi:DNA-binding transcriptional ArsR family regulator